MKEKKKSAKIVVRVNCLPLQNDSVTSNCTKKRNYLHITNWYESRHHNSEHKYRINTIKCELMKGISLHVNRNGKNKKRMQIFTKMATNNKSTRQTEGRKKLSRTKDKENRFFLCAVHRILKLCILPLLFEGGKRAPRIVSRECLCVSVHLR